MTLHLAGAIRARPSIQARGRENGKRACSLRSRPLSPSHGTTTTKGKERKSLLVVEGSLASVRACLAGHRPRPSGGSKAEGRGISVTN